MSRREAPGTTKGIRGSFIPWGWFAEDGTTRVRTDYPALFAVIGTNFNTGAESILEFRLPDSRGKADVGAGHDTGRGLSSRLITAPYDITGPSAVGGETHTLSTGESVPHNHSAPAHNHRWLSAGGGNGVQGPGVGVTATFNSAGAATGQADGTDNYTDNAGSGSTGAVSSTGAATAHNNMPPALIATKMIKW